MLDTLIEKFGLIFPTTRIFSELARSSLPEVSAKDDPDASLVGSTATSSCSAGSNGALLPRGSAADLARLMMPMLTAFSDFRSAYRTGENPAPAPPLKTISRQSLSRMTFAMHVVSRRKTATRFSVSRTARVSRSGISGRASLHARIKVNAQGSLEAVLSEAERIDNKHLLTLEPGISENQTNEMQTKKLQLVLPRKIHATYKPAQQTNPARWPCRLLVDLLHISQMPCKSVGMGVAVGIARQVEGLSKVG